MSPAPSRQAATRGEPGYVWRSGQERRMAMIRQWVDLGGRILDNGCGLGTYLKAFAPFSNQRYGLELELDRAQRAVRVADAIIVAPAEQLPFATNSFDFILSNEVIEHVENDQAAVVEMVRVAKPGGRIVIFCPNRYYPVEQHGIYWRGEYRFGNIPLVNYLPDNLRNRLAPHVRAYRSRELLALFQDLPVDMIHHARIFGGYDNIAYRWPRLGNTLRKVLYKAEKTPFAFLGISHFVVLEKKLTN